MPELHRVRRRRWRVSAAVLVVLTMAASFAVPSPAAAKGGPNPIDYVIISGGGLPAARQVAITLPDDYDFMGEVSTPPAATTRYDLRIHLTWPDVCDSEGRIVQKTQQWVIEAVYDGGDLLRLDQEQHGERVGWFRANPLFASQLRAALSEPAPPAAGSGLAAEGPRTRGRAGAAPPAEALLLIALLAAAAGISLAQADASSNPKLGGDC